MAAVETPERRFSKAGPAGGCPGVCGGCPGARSCGALVEFEKGKKKLDVDSLSEVPEGFQGIIKFRSAIQGRGEVPVVPNETSEKTCDKCGKTASTCPHLGTSRRAA